MPRHKGIPPEGARILAAALERVRPAEGRMLSDLELDWPGSRALLGRLGEALAVQDPTQATGMLSECLVGGLRAYRAAREARVGDQQRFAAFVAGLKEALDDSDQPALLTASLSPLQQRALRLAEEDHG